MKIINNMDEYEILVEIYIEQELPKKAGKYIVKTKTSMGNIHRLECVVTIGREGKCHFHVNNQKVISWYKSNLF